MRSTKSHILDRTRTKYAGIFACVFAFVLSVALCPGVAQAEVRNSDVVLGQTIEEQGFTAAQAPNIVAEYAYLVSSDGTIYFARNAYDQVHIASITKIMTALVAVSYTHLDVYKRQAIFLSSHVSKCITTALAMVRRISSACASAPQLRRISLA